MSETHSHTFRANYFHNHKMIDDGCLPSFWKLQTILHNILQVEAGAGLLRLSTGATIAIHPAPPQQGLP